MHAFVLGELSLGSLGQRKKTLATLRTLPTAVIAQPNEVESLIEIRSLHGRGIGYIDTHLIASALIMPDTVLWTRDKRLRIVAESMKIHVQFP